MKLNLYLVSIILTLQTFAFADSNLVHNVGKVQMAVSDWGAFTKLENGQVYSNFIYANKSYLDPFSEVWVGDSTGYVASAYDGFDEGIAMGEWQATVPSGNIVYMSDCPSASQCTHAQYAPDRYEDFPFNITIDQYTYAWDSTIYPNDDDYIMIKLILTNHGTSELKDIFLAVQTNWDVDFDDWEDDLVDWDAVRYAGIVYDSNGTDPTYVALSLLSGKFASHNIIDASNWGYLDSDRAKLMSNGEIDDLKTIGSKVGNYSIVISTGPYNILPGESISTVYAFVAGGNLEELRGNIDSAKARSMTPHMLIAEPSSSAIKLSWSPSINPEVVAYRVYRSSVSGGKYSEIAEVSAENHSFSDVNVNVGNMYYYVVAAVGPNGKESKYSNEVSSSPGVAPPPPQNLIVRNDPFSSKPLLYWEPAHDEEITGYKIFRNFTGTQPWTAIATVGRSANFYFDQDTYDGYTYYYTVASVNIFGWISEYSNVVSIAVDLQNPPEPANNLDEVKVVPNPCKQYLPLKFTHLTAKANIRIYTISGELVKTLYHYEGGGEEEWDLRNDAGERVSSGIYVYYIEAYKTDSRGKFAKRGKFAIE